ncbi:protein kinase [Tenacibaculum soleae]|uniref:protein kinase domain-containing protein n=1 Tax=Tenacibaculum soleae TaxID=447689 RepID=UPI0026E18774|nr:protein kinase [Tenacibaculum soleae]MDO6743841.1 protein kinase [Tenacibaculum soleae]
MINTIVEIEHIEDFSEQGFYSRSYLAFDKRLNRHVAVKDIIYENLTSESDFEKYFEEAYKVSMAAHPRVLPIFYVGLDHNDSEIIPRIVSSFFSNGSLNSYLEQISNQGQSICLDEAIRFAHDIIQGMIHLHMLDIVHLDLKASNIFIGDDRKLIIGDFGQAKFIKDGIIKDASNIYPAITPKEILKKKTADKTADIYQFGMLLFSIFCYPIYRDAIDNNYQINTATLKTLFRDKPDNVDELKKEFSSNIKRYFKDVSDGSFPDKSSYPLYVPKKIQDIIHKCLESNVKDRYNNFYEIQTDLNDFIFPKDVSLLYQDFSTGSINFLKEQKPCVLTINESSGKYDVKATKNGRSVTDCCKSGVTTAKIQNILFKLAAQI